jgi:predicted  nucleic acid-binding Zn-ribbon protein
VSDFAPRFGLALIVVIVAVAAIIIARRNYAKSAIFERNIDAFRLELQRSIDAAQAATIKSVAKTIRDAITSVVKPTDSTMRELDARLARLEQQQADTTASHMAGAQILDVRLGRLEEHADASAVRNLETRFAGLEKQTEAAASQITGTRKQALEENERIAARLIGVEQKLTAQSDRLSSIKQTVDDAALREQENLASLSDQQQNLTGLIDQLSSIKQTVDKTTEREQDIKNSIDAISSRVLNTQTRLNELFPRLVLGDKARHDQSTVFNLFVKRLKKFNTNLSDMGLRLSALESDFRSKAKRLDEHDSSILERADRLLEGDTELNAEDPDKDPKAADGAVAIEAKTELQNGKGSEKSSQGEESPSEANLETEGGSAKNPADQHAT